MLKKEWYRGLKKNEKIKKNRERDGGLQKN